MSLTPAVKKGRSAAPRADGCPPVQALTGRHTPEVLAFLDTPTIDSAIMTTFICDNGLVSPLNRGAFYACRGLGGAIEGVSLVGHLTLIKASSGAVFKSFARLVRECPRARTVLGEREEVERFWSYYAPAGQPPQRLCRELMFEQRQPTEVREFVPGLRRAAAGDVGQVLPVHALMAFKESGVDPRERDAEGFRRRTEQRIAHGRAWVWIEGGKLIFKADVVAETPEVAYLEGIYIAPEERGKGYGTRCMSQLSRTLLARSKTICLLVNEQHRQAQGFYHRAGYNLRAHYDTIFLQPPTRAPLNSAAARAEL